MSLVLLAISLSVALGVLAFRFAVFALPVMAGIAAFLQVNEGGAGFGLAFLAGLAGAALSVALVIAILGFARNPFLRLGALGLFAAPASPARKDRPKPDPPSCTCRNAAIPAMTGSAKTAKRKASKPRAMDREMARRTSDMDASMGQ